jgi:cellobiose-specific phosphotransferase system component IIC
MIATSASLFESGFSPTRTDTFTQMFWRFGFHNASAIDGILDKEGVTLDDIMREEELVITSNTR